MLSLLGLPLSLLLPLFQQTANAVIIPFEVRASSFATSLTRRGPIPVGNTGNAQYVSNVTLGGTTVQVLLDTGSSDLWTHFPSSTPSSATDTGKQVTLSYAVGKAGGNVQTIDVQFGNFTVKDQAFLNVVNTSSFTSDIHQQGYDGLLGLGPNSGSVIRKKLGNSVGDSFIQRLFQETKATANFITFWLDRKNDPGSTLKGQFTINEVLSTYSNISTMPKLDVDRVNRLLKADQHWQALTDANIGIIGPDGNPVELDSIIPDAPKGQFVAVIDSGFTFSQVPREVSDAIYGRVRGAYYDAVNEWWLVPCGQYLNISFNFGGRNYPIHPLDVVDDNFNKVDSTGKKVCIGAFQPITSAFSILGHYDMILGMSFLRNAYTLLDFGTWITGGNDKQSPFIQMLATTNANFARSNFVQVRLSGTDTISDSRWSLLPADQMQHSPISDEEKKKKYQEMVLSRWPYIFVGCLAFVLLLIGCCIWRCCKRRRAKKAKASNTTAKFGDVFSKDVSAQRSLSQHRQSYVPLEGKGSTTDLRTTPEPLPAYTQSQEVSYGSAHPLQPEYQQSDYGAQQEWQQGYANGNYSQQSLPQSFDQAGHPQHDSYPPQRF